MRNAAYDEFVAIRHDLERRVTDLLAHVLSIPADDYYVGRLAGALSMLIALPYSSGIGETLHHRLKAAHKLNRSRRTPCGCGTLKSCHVEGVSVPELLSELARDPELRFSEWDFEVAQAAVARRPTSPRQAPVAYDRDGLDRAILALLTSTTEGLTVSEMLEQVGHPDATSHRLGARLSSMKRRGVVTDWTFTDDWYMTRVWEIATGATGAPS